MKALKENITQTKITKNEETKFWLNILPKMKKQNSNLTIPIIPFLKKLFRCKNKAQFMDYHAHNRSQDDILQMPADGSTFRDMEEKWPRFKEEPHNARLSLAADGVNPFSEMRSTCSA